MAEGALVYGKPDLIFPEKKVAVFVDGCFWHGHPTRFRQPKSNAVFWRNKIQANRKRDKLVNRTLRRQGWIVVRIWESELARPALIKKKLRVLT